MGKKVGKRRSETRKFSSFGIPPLLRNFCSCDKLSVEVASMAVKSVYIVVVWLLSCFLLLK